jgi:hypothetical protein
MKEDHVRKPFLLTERDWQSISMVRKTRGVEVFRVRRGKLAKRCIPPGNFKGRQKKRLLEYSSVAICYI